MGFIEDTLGVPRPEAVADIALPGRQQYHPSPVSWRDEVVYFLLVDRFSDGLEGTRSRLDRQDLAAFRPDSPAGEPWRWDRWSASGHERFQGGTIQGVTSKLDYLSGLGATTVWLSPVFRQRLHQDSYHGYGAQDFLDVDPRFGTRADLVDLVRQAHRRDMRVILDVIFNHSGSNWLYPPGTPGGQEMASYTTGRYPFGSWRGPDGEPIGAPVGPEDAVWPTELQRPDAYTRAGTGSLGAGGLEDPAAEFRRSDFVTLRDFDLDAPGVLADLARCYKYWIALTDCDGFRIDTVKHVTFDHARDFCGTITEFAHNLGKRNFLLIGEVAGGDYSAGRYLDVLGRNLDAALDIGEARLALRDVTKGLAGAQAYFQLFHPGAGGLGSHRELGDKHVSVLDDHDHVMGEKLRFATDAANDHQAAAAVAVQLLTLGIPCIYYGTEQGLAGPEPAERRWLPEWGANDRYLREAMFGPRHPRRAGRAGTPVPGAGTTVDEDLPGFGPFGTAGAHCFDPSHPIYVRVGAVARARVDLPVLREGRQYLRHISVFGEPFAPPGAGELVAWSRILDGDEALCVVNVNAADARGADVVVDAGLNRSASSFTVVLNTAQSAAGDPGAHPVGSTVAVQRRADGTAYVAVRGLAPSETLVLLNNA